MSAVPWFKLVGSTENPLPDDWVQQRPDLLTAIRFPWNKPPSDIWAPGKLVLYAVGSGALIAVQRVDGPPQLLPRRGAPGTAENRWPHKLAVKTERFCPSVCFAPKLRDDVPTFAAKYGSRFRNGSHWAITDEEFAVLDEVIRSAGQEAS
jgi:hypothetical protein